MTEIAPGMMVECIDDNPGYRHRHIKGISKGRYFVKEIYKKEELECPKCKSRCSIEVHGNKYHYCIHRFRPIGGDKEIEKEQFKKIKATDRLNYIEKVKND